MDNRYHAFVSTVCVFLSILFFSFLRDFLTPQLIGIAWLTPIVSTTATIGFYVSIYQGLMWVYFKYLNDIFNKEEAISGEWFYRLTVNDPDNCRYGICRIEKDGLYSIRMSGVNYNPTHKRHTSHFFSVFLEIKKRDILVMYDARSPGSKLDATRGMFFMQTTGTPPSEIHGLWADVLPSRNAGAIQLARRTSQTDIIAQKFGMPTNMSEIEILFGLNKENSVATPPTNEK